MYGHYYNVFTRQFLKTFWVVYLAYSYYHTRASPFSSTDRKQFGELLAEEWWAGEVILSVTLLFNDLQFQFSLWLKPSGRYLGERAGDSHGNSHSSPPNLSSWKFRCQFIWKASDQYPNLQVENFKKRQPTIVFYWNLAWFSADHPCSVKVWNFFAHSSFACQFAYTNPNHASEFKLLYLNIFNDFPLFKII